MVTLVDGLLVTGGDVVDAVIHVVVIVVGVWFIISLLKFIEIICVKFYEMCYNHILEPKII